MSIVDAQGPAQGVRRHAWHVELEGNLVDRADTLDLIGAGEDFWRWVDSLLSVADVRLSLRRGVQAHLIGAEPAEQLQRRRVLLAPATRFSTYSSRSPAQRSLIALCQAGAAHARLPHARSYDASFRPAAALNTVLARRESDSALKANDVLGTLRRYLDRLPEVQNAALVQHGDENGKTDECVTVGNGAKLARGGDEQVMLSNTLSTMAHGDDSHNQLVPTAPRALLAAHDALPDLLFKPTEDAPNSSLRTLLLTAAADDTRSSSKGAGSAAGAPRTTPRRVTAARGPRGGAGDWGGRGEACRAQLGAIWFLVDPQKYVKPSSDDVEQQLKAIYR
ncbi:hypothetical protein C8R47DRAFT_1214027 [Mycena vitilis]|nr:hypothetical protein C8R47DRAFT_1214027 [Mycena vitilis]